MTRFAGKARRLGLFALVPLIGIISPYLAIPVLTKLHGSEAWAAVAIGQSLGMALAVPIELGWALVGPQAVARASAWQRRRLAAHAVTSRIVVAIPVTCLAGVAGFLLSASYPIVSATTAVGTAIAGLSMTWYLIGVGKPLLILATDSLPKLAGVLVSVALLLHGVPLIAYPAIGILAPAVIAPLLSLAVSGVRPKDFRRIGLARTRRTIADQSNAALGRTVSSLYMALPTAILGVANPGAVASFAAADRLTRVGLAILSSVPSTLQGWVGEPKRERTRRDRARRAVLANAALGLVSAVVAALALPFAAELLFSGTVHVSIELALFCGLMVFAVCTSRATGNLALVARSDVRSVTRSAIAGASCGVPAIWLLGHSFGAVGAMAGVALAESVVLLVQLAALRPAKPVRADRPSQQPK